MRDCPMPECDGSLYYDTCEECGFREEAPRARRTGGAGATRQPLSDEDYRREMEKLHRGEK